MLIKTEAVVLRAVRYGDSRLIVDMLTLSEGRESFIVGIPKSSRGRLQKQLFQVLTLLDIEYDRRPGNHLQHLKDVSRSYPFASIPFNPQKIAVTLFLSEFLCYATRGEQGANEHLFRFVSAALRWLDTVEGQFANFHLAFMIHLTRFLGFFPNIEGYHPGFLFDLRSGCFTSVAPLHSDFLNAADTSRMAVIMRMDFENMRFFHFTHEERNRCTEVILYYYRIHVPEFPELRSFDVVRQLFA